MTSVTSNLNGWKNKIKIEIEKKKKRTRQKLWTPQRIRRKRNKRKTIHDPPRRGCHVSFFSLSYRPSCGGGGGHFLLFRIGDVVQSSASFSFSAPKTPKPVVVSNGVVIIIIIILLCWAYIPPSSPGPFFSCYDNAGQWHVGRAWWTPPCSLTIGPGRKTNQTWPPTYSRGPGPTTIFNDVEPLVRIRKHFPRRSLFNFNEISKFGLLLARFTLNETTAAHAESNNSYSGVANHQSVIVEKQNTIRIRNGLKMKERSRRRSRRLGKNLSAHELFITFH